MDVSGRVGPIQLNMELLKYCKNEIEELVNKKI